MNPTQDKLTLTNANTEYSYQIPPQCKSFSFKDRSGGYDILYAFVTGDIAAAKYSTLSAGSTQVLKGRFEPTTVYFQCAQAGEIVEIEYIV